MGVTLHFGVVDVAYSDANGSGATTTGQVAAILEKNYGIMATFYRLRQEKIASALADSMAASIQRMVATGERIDKRATLTYGADQKIEAMFRQFIFSNEISKLFQAFSGAPISAAAASGVNHRLKSPYAKKNKARPAFVDTGLYVSSFRAWSTADVRAAVAST